MPRKKKEPEVVEYSDENEKIGIKYKFNLQAYCKAEGLTEEEALRERWIQIVLEINPVIWFSHEANEESVVGMAMDGWWMGFKKKWCIHKNKNENE